MEAFYKIAQKIPPENYSIRVKAITVRLCISDCSGRIWFTDVLLQDGSIATGWVGNPSEIRWTLDG